MSIDLPFHCQNPCRVKLCAKWANSCLRCIVALPFCTYRVKYVVLFSIIPYSLCILNMHQANINCK